MAPHRLVALAMAAAAAASAVASASMEEDNARLLAESLSADEGTEACSADSEEDCALELRQLRAAERRSAVGEHEHKQTDEPEQMGDDEGVAQFGDEAQGRKMWKETTWDEILLELKSNVSDECTRETPGTCSVLGCAASRGSTECFGGKCMCPEGYCAVTGICFPKAGQCMDDTGGTCSVGTCSSSRGKTKCKEGKCKCKSGGCAFRGKCWPVTDTGGSCTVAECSTSRGDVTCHKGRCLCKEGFVAIQGRCEPFAE